MEDLTKTLIAERKKLLSKHILSKEDQSAVELIESKLLDLEFPSEAEVPQNKVLWTKDHLTVLYTLGKKPSEDTVAVNNSSKPILVNVKLNLRESDAARTKFEKKLKDLITPDEFNEIYTKIIGVCGVGSVDGVDTSYKPNFLNIYVPVDASDDTVCIHPALDFTSDMMYVGVSLMAKDMDGKVDLMPFILNSNGLLAIPSLPEYSIRLLKEPMVYKKYFKAPTSTKGYTPPTLTTLPTPKLADCYINIKKELDTYVEFSDSTISSMLSLWIIGTYIYKIFNAYPYISLLGFKGSGKTRTMEICSYMSFNGTTSVGISPSALFRGTDCLSWSLFFDEAELFKAGDKRSKRAEELMPLILAGYKKGGRVPRIGSKENGFKLEFFDTYCPKMFASTEEMDWILESRCVQIVMRPAVKGGAGEVEPDEFNEKWEDIRTSILYACLNEWQVIKDEYLTMVNDTSMTNRDYELSKSLLAIAKSISEEVYNEIKTYMEQTTTNKTDENLERTEFYVLKALVVMDRWEDLLTSADILGKVTELKGGFRPDWMNSTWLGRQLKKLNFKYEKPRSKHGFNYVFKQDDVYSACRRFGIDPEALEKEFKPEIKADEVLEKQRGLAEW